MIRLRAMRKRASPSACLFNTMASVRAWNPVDSGTMWHYNSSMKVAHVVRSCGGGGAWQRFGLALHLKKTSYHGLAAGCLLACA